MRDFVAIDVETANNYPESICAVGAVRVEGGRLTDRFYELVKPEPEYFNRYFTDCVHGISAADVENSRNFKEVWSDLQNKILGDLPLVAHNSSFDERCVRAAFRMYGMDYPDYRFYCTLQKARRVIPRQMCRSRSLPSLCDFFGIPFSGHHNALADAEGAAKLACVLFAADQEIG